MTYTGERFRAHRHEPQLGAEMMARYKSRGGASADIFTMGDGEDFCHVVYIGTAGVIVAECEDDLWDDDQSGDDRLTVSLTDDGVAVDRVETWHTGGGTACDIIHLTDGRVVGVDEATVCLYPSRDGFYDSDPSYVPWVEFSRMIHEGTVDAPYLARITTKVRDPFGDGDEVVSVISVKRPNPSMGAADVATCRRPSGDEITVPVAQLRRIGARARNLTAHRPDGRGHLRMKEEDQMWKVKCISHSSMFGYRQAYAKRNGDEIEFGNEDDAQAYCSAIDTSGRFDAPQYYPVRVDHHVGDDGWST